MKKTCLLFLLPLFSLTLSSCSTGFKMIDEGDHGNTYSGGSSQNPIQGEEIDAFIKKAKEKLKSDEYKKYDSKFSNVYFESKAKEKDEPRVDTTSTTLIRNNTSLSSEIIIKGNETKKNIIYADASNENSLKVLVDAYISDNEVKHYICEETIKDGGYEYLQSYYHTSCMSYLDNMVYMLDNFSLLYNIACIFNDPLNEAMQYVNCFKGEAYIKQNNKQIIYNFYNFDLQHEKMNTSGTIYFTGDYDIAKLNISFYDKLEQSSSSAYISLLPYDKNIKVLNQDNRDLLLPKDLENLIH